MTHATLDLTDLARKLANRKSGRTEANIQSWLHTFLLAAPLQLVEGELQDIVLEQPAGDRRRIDVEAGSCVFEVKRDLRAAHVLADAEIQLADYVAKRTHAMGQRYVGVLTDGAAWRLYRLQGAALTFVSALELNADQPNVDALCVWLEGVLATTDSIAPNPLNIERFLGARSPSHLLDVAELTELYQTFKDRPDLRLKRELWAKLLTTALGTAFNDDDALFIQHTLLVVTAEVIAHAVLGLQPDQIPPLSLVAGHAFRNAKILGVVEADFFDWPAEVPGGETFVRGLARRLSRFAWTDVHHDVLKVLYESVIAAQQRKQLGEYYTPDWLADRVVTTTIDNPLESKVLDPSCGSGTFLFYAVRHYLAAADQAQLPNKETLTSLCAHVMGMDLHPVAVTLARVTYLLAIGRDRLTKDREGLSIPVFLGDSLQWAEDQKTSVLQQGALVIRTVDAGELFATELRFPDSLMSDATKFDELVAELATRATAREGGSPYPSLSQIHRRYAIPADAQPTVEKTFRMMCSLRDQGRDHIWGYYVRNLARPRWLARKDNHVDVLIGNPPWLSYRFMPRDMQAHFQQLATERNLWPGAASVTHVDLSALFVVRAIERYLKQGGRFAFVMPLAVLTRPYFAGFRAGKWSSETDYSNYAAFDAPSDLHQVKPPFFKVPASIVSGRHVDRREQLTPLPSDTHLWRGRLPAKNLAWPEAQHHITITTGTVTTAPTSEHASPYGDRFAQGASLVPRVLCFVDEVSAGPLGQAAGETRITSHRSSKEKEPWKSLPALAGSVETNFIFPAHLGDTILPFRTLTPFKAVIPWDAKRLLHGADELLASYPRLYDWWTAAERVWNDHRSSPRLSLIKQINFRNKLVDQFLTNGCCPPIRLVYSKSGMYLAAAVITDPNAIIDHKLYWAACSTVDEARYLAAVLNSEQATLRVRSFQARGEHNPRDFDMYVWQLPIPAFDPTSALHTELANLAAQAQQFVATLTLPANVRFEAQRRFVRSHLAASPLGNQIEAAVTTLLAAPAPPRTSRSRTRTRPTRRASSPLR